MCMECFYVLSNVISTEDGEMNITDENPVAILSQKSCWQMWEWFYSPSTCLTLSS